MFKNISHKNDMKWILVPANNVIWTKHLILVLKKSIQLDHYELPTIKIIHSTHMSVKIILSRVICIPDFNAV